MPKSVPRWKSVQCPRCQAQPGHSCFMERGNLNLVHVARLQAADLRISAVLHIGGAKRKITPAMRYWSDACRTGHPEECSGRRRSKLDRGWKPCENPIHKVTAEQVTKVHIDVPASVE